jgi:hypothetical protein
VCFEKRELILYFEPTECKESNESHVIPIHDRLYKQIHDFVFRVRAYKISL